MQSICDPAALISSSDPSGLVTRASTPIIASLQSIKQEPSQPPSNSSASSALIPQIGGKRQQTPAFLEKLFDILEENSPYASLIGWQPDGNSFIIKKVNEFSEIVLPKYFKHSNMQSYIRQLNMYGFSKTRHDSNHHEFTHTLFQRGRRDLLVFIRRKMQQNSSASGNVQRILGVASVIGNGRHSTRDALLNVSRAALKPRHLSDDLLYEGEEEDTNSTDDNRSSLNMNTVSSSSAVIGSSSSTSTVLSSDERIVVLERQLRIVTAHCLQLTEQHNLLCSALQTNHALYLHDRRTSKDDCMSPKATDDDRCLKRLKSNRDELRILDTAQDTDYTRYSASTDAFYAITERERKLSTGCTDSEQSSCSVNTTPAGHAISRSELTKSYSVDMCGLEAITSAALLLDYHSRATPSASISSTESIGAPLTKSYSIG